MRTVFADSLFWIAVTNPHDQWSEGASGAFEALGPVLLVTTDEVLIEFLAALSKGGPNVRKNAVEMTQAILKDPNVNVLTQTRESFL